MASLSPCGCCCCCSVALVKPGGYDFCSPLDRRNLHVLGTGPCPDGALLILADDVVIGAEKGDRHCQQLLSTLPPDLLPHGPPRPSIKCLHYSPEVDKWSAYLHSSPGPSLPWLESPSQGAAEVLWSYLQDKGFNGFCVLDQDSQPARGSRPHAAASLLEPALAVWHRQLGQEPVVVEEPPSSSSPEPTPAETGFELAQQVQAMDMDWVPSEATLVKACLSEFGANTREPATPSAATPFQRSPSPSPSPLPPSLTPSSAVSPMPVASSLGPALPTSVAVTGSRDDGFLLAMLAYTADMNIWYQHEPHPGVVALAGHDCTHAHHLLATPGGSYELVDCDLCNGRAPFPSAVEAKVALLTQPAMRPCLSLHVAAAGGCLADLPPYRERVCQVLSCRPIVIN